MKTNKFHPHPLLLETGSCYVALAGLERSGILPSFLVLELQISTPVIEVEMLQGIGKKTF
jgi:hypothetical protein